MVCAELVGADNRERFDCAKRRIPTILNFFHILSLRYATYIVCRSRIIYKIGGVTPLSGFTILAKCCKLACACVGNKVTQLGSRVEHPCRLQRRSLAVGVDE